MNYKQRKYDISKLPRYILLDIFYYLPWQEIFLTVAHTNKELFKLFHDPIFLRFYMNKAIIFNNYKLNIKLFSMSIKEIMKFLIQNFQQKYEELPFWGYKTDSGIYKNIFNYWIEKSFSQSSNQMVSYRKVANVHIEGAMATDILEFKDVMIKMSEKLNSYYLYYKLHLKQFPTQYSLINIDQIFYQYYESSQSSTYLEESGKSFWNHFLKYDAQLEHAIDYDEININQSYKEIKFSLASVYSLHISRKGSFTRPAKTIMLFYKEEDEIIKKKDISKSVCIYDYVQLFDNCSSYGQFKLLMYQNKSYMPKISKDSAGNGYHYVLFERNEKEIVNYYYPILWLQFQDDFTKEFIQKLNINQRFLANKILIKIINHCSQDIDLCGDSYDQTFQEPLNGPGFSFVSLKGVQLNTKSIYKYSKKKQLQSKIRPKSRIRNKTTIN